MKRSLYHAASRVLTISFAVVTQAISAPPAMANDAKDAQGQRAVRGKYLVHTSGCMDCHTPFKMGEKGPEFDLSRLLSGHPQMLKMPPAPTLSEGPWLAVSSATNTAFS